RVAVVLHGIEAWTRQDIVTRHLLGKVHRIFADSDHTWTGFIESNPEFSAARHQTLYLGLGSPLDMPTPAPAHFPATLMIGRLDTREDYKGHRQMIGAWPSVLERMPDAQLWIVGSGNLREELQEFAR